MGRTACQFCMIIKMVRMTCAVEAENYPGPSEMDLSENYGETPWKTEIEIHEIHIKPSCSLSKLPFGGVFWPIFSDKSCGRSSDCRSFTARYDDLVLAQHRKSQPHGHRTWMYSRIVLLPLMFSPTRAS